MSGLLAQIDKDARHAGDHLAIFDNGIEIAGIGERLCQVMAVDLADITQTALLAIEGERDDISGLGQTKAALDLTPKLSDRKKRYYMAEGAGHYGIFNGSKWRGKIAPVEEEFIAAHG